MSRFGEVSRELVLEFPGELIDRPVSLPDDVNEAGGVPDPADAVPPVVVFADRSTVSALIDETGSSDGGMMSESPETEADLITDRDR